VLFPSDQTTAAEMLAALDREMQTDPRFGQRLALNWSSTRPKFPALPWAKDGLMFNLGGGLGLELDCHRDFAKLRAYF